VSRKDSPDAWLAWASRTLDAQSRPFSPRMEWKPRYDHRTKDSREVALSVKILAEKASHKVCGNGVGFKLLMDFYVAEMFWHSFTGPEQAIIHRMQQDFAERLVAAGFLPPDRGRKR